MGINHSGLQKTPNIIEVIRSLYGKLRKSDRKVANAVIADPEKIMNSTIGKTAEIAEVSQPTVIRFCTAIGCEGFQDLKIRLAQSLALGAATHSAISDDDSPSDVTAKIFAYTMTSLDWAKNHLDLVEIERAVDIILGAASLKFFGFGASAIVALDMQQKFPLFGIPCNATLDSHQQFMSASMMRPDDVAVVISNTGRTNSIIDIARIAREQGARVIGITGSKANPLADYCDVVINVETPDNTDVFTPTTSRIAALVAGDIMSTLVVRGLGVAHNERLTRMKRQLKQKRQSDSL
ncbi:MAG: SIS domain-containing protein [Proteobacteria bacterium]|nr:SIS domain-containing protein [Pseudomonadota bacterium]